MSDNFSFQFQSSLRHTLSEATSFFIDSEKGLVGIGALGGLYVCPTSLFHLTENDLATEDGAKVDFGSPVVITEGVALVGHPNGDQVVVAVKGGNTVHTLSWPGLEHEHQEVNKATIPSPIADLLVGYTSSGSTTLTVRNSEGSGTGAPSMVDPP